MSNFKSEYKSTPEPLKPTSDSTGAPVSASADTLANPAKNGVNTLTGGSIMFKSAVAVSSAGTNLPLGLHV